MPSYEYTCRDCGTGFTVYLTFKEYDEKPKINCPHCGSDNVHKNISGFFAKTSKKS